MPRGVIFVPHATRCSERKGLEAYARRESGHGEPRFTIDSSSTSIDFVLYRLRETYVISYIRTNDSFLVLRATKTSYGAEVAYVI